MSDQPADAESSTNATAQHAGPAPLDPRMVPFAVGGLAAWAVAGLLALASRAWLAEHGHGSWLRICVAGFLIGIPGLAIMVRHDARREARHGGEAGNATDG